MPKTEPLAVSWKIQEALFFAIMDQTHHQEQQVELIDAKIRPLVEALEDARARGYTSLPGGVCKICIKEPQIFQRIDAALRRAKGE